MRIISGKLKGRSLTAPKGQNTRPTSDRAREAIFNVLEHADWAPPLDGARVIDLFAGSGGLGLEAISRGADFALFVETDNAARGAIRQNIEDFQLFGCTRIHRRSATALGPRPSNLGAPFDLAFLDPPYPIWRAPGDRRRMLSVVTAVLNEAVKPTGVLVLHTAPKDLDGPDLNLPADAKPRIYGNSALWFLRPADAP